MKLVPLSILLTTFALLTGCVPSSTMQNEFDCPLNDGVPACLDTYDVDVKGELPKSPGSVNNTDQDTVGRIQDKTVRDGLEDEKVVVDRDTTYPVMPLVKQPVRQFGSTERMWFAPWQDVKNDLYIDQQYIYWAEKGKWMLSGGRAW